MNRSIFPILLTTLIFNGSLGADSGEWGLEPLGQVIEAQPEEAPKKKQELKTRFQKFPAEGVPLVVYEKGAAQCLVILPENPSTVEQESADLFASTLREMTGGEVPVVTEEKVRAEGDKSGAFVVVDTQRRRWPHAIWIGRTQRAKEQGIGPDDLLPEGYRLRSEGSWLFVMGNDKSSTGKQLSGTYFGMAALLEQHLGVRWLWPGRLGTVIDKSDRVVLAPINEQDEPALVQRLIRSGFSITDRNKIGLKLLGGTEKEDQNYLQILKDRRAWLTKSKEGGSVELKYRHAFGKWYEKYGETHPEWFALQPSGSRKQVSERPRLCKSNPEVAKQRAVEIIEEFKADPEAVSASISPNDGSGQDHFCMCIECRKLDPPNGNRRDLGFSREGKRFLASYPSLSDRVATFYNRIAEEVVKTRPDAVLGAYAYSAYRDVPLGVTLHPSIIVGFVGLGYFDDNARKVDLTRWDGWSRHSSHLFLRPNLLHQGASLPAIYVHRLAEDIRHCYETGMIVADFDSLTGNWATQGLNYYILAKLLWDPTADVDALIEDYCRKGFGEAGGKIHEYFTAVENAVNRVAEREEKAVEGELRGEEEDAPVDPRKKKRDVFDASYFKVFTPEFTGHLRSLLAQASKKAPDETVRARIAFLACGLDYADLYRATLDGADKVQARKEMLAWFRKIYHEQPEAINAVGHLWRTHASYRGIK